MAYSHAMEMRLPRPRHGDPVETTAQLRELAAAVLSEDVRALARTTAYLRRSYRVVFIGYIAMLVFGLAAVVAAFVKGLTASSVGQAVAGVGLAGLTVGGGDWAIASGVAENTEANDAPSARPAPPIKSERRLGPLRHRDAGLSERAAAKKLGTSQTQLRRMEDPRYLPSLRSLARVANAQN